MQLHPRQKPVEAFQQPITAEQLSTICARAFGSAHPITAFHELSGGTINTTYRVTLSNHPAVIVRVAPCDSHPHLFSHEHHLLRRECFIQPFLAPIGHLLPTLYLADFTHQIVARDILIQAAIPGDLWRDIQPTLTRGAATALWQQLGLIARQIHRVEHHAFGPADPVPAFQYWSDTLLMDFQNMLHDMAIWGLPSQLVQQVRDHLAQHRSLFDCIRTPHLLHGDLWLNNLLVQHSHTGAHIVGVLDAGFAQWGDPAADWTMMRMSLSPPAGAEAFWAGYGSLSQESDAILRTTIYQARALGRAHLVGRYSNSNGDSIRIGRGYGRDWKQSRAISNGRSEKKSSSTSFKYGDCLATQHAHAVDRLRRARSLLFWRFLVQRASSAADARSVSRRVNRHATLNLTVVVHLF